MRSVTQGDAQSIQYALADYFRYVAGHVAYEHQGEAIARQAAILDAVKRSMADAVECTARVAELERKLTEARLELDSSEKRAAQFEQESTRLFVLTNKQAHLLTQTGMTLRCYEQEPVTTSELHDLPGRAAALRSQLDCALRATEKRYEQEAQSAKPEFQKRTMVSDDGRPLVKPAKRHSFVMDSIARVLAMVKDREK